MSQNVLLEEGGSVNVHTRIKDMCKAARNRLGLTNQDISNLISERFGIDDFSVNTVNNFFSERSKATTIYTTGYISAVLGSSGVKDLIFFSDGLLPIAHLNPAENAIPVLPPFLIIVWKKPLNLSPQRFCTPTPY